MKSSLQTSAGLLTERLARHHADLTGSERALAEALQRDYPHALLESATALAARNGTSASTVVRLFAKLGYASYAEAQREARAEVTALLQTAGQRAPVTIGAERTLQQCVDDALLHDQHNLSATRDGLNLARIFHRSRATNEDGIALVCPKIQVSNLDQRAGNAEAKLYRRN